MNRFILFFLQNKLVAFLLLGGLTVWGLSTAPFDWGLDFLPRDPVAVDAIPDIGENQQIVFTTWQGRSPKDVEDQITYPLTTALLGLPGVRTIRSSSLFGLSSIYVIFEEEVEYYWSRSRILEKLNSLPASTLPADVTPVLGPDATALGQVFWYTLEGRDEEGEVTGGWDLQELRSIQDFQVRYALGGVKDVAEVASIGGFVKEYQVDVDPEALERYGISLAMVADAVRNSNLDIGAKTIEINRVEYLVRGLGYINRSQDLADAVVLEKDNTPVTVGDLAKVSLGPASRRGALDKEGAEVVGGVVVARYGANPLEVIEHVKEKIAEIGPGLPTKELADGRTSQVTLVPFYDRTTLIHETLGTLEEALSLELWITVLVILLMLAEVRSSLIVAFSLPVAILFCFVAMRQFGVDANIVALSGIAIAIGTMVDVGIVLSENVVRHIRQAPEESDSDLVVYEGIREVAPAVFTAVATTIVSFLPVFTLQAAEGKLFRPLAFTKTFALLAVLLVGFAFVPAISSILFKKIRSTPSWLRPAYLSLLALAGIVILIWVSVLPGILMIALSVFGWLRYRSLFEWRYSEAVVLAVGVAIFLAQAWSPLGAGVSGVSNLLFVALSIIIVLGTLLIFRRYYLRMLGVFLRNKKSFLLLPACVVLLGSCIWIGFPRIFDFAARGLDSVGLNIRTTTVWSSLAHSFPGLSQEFMPALDEGSFLLMPTSMPHSGMEENLRVLRQLDMAVAAIPEVEMVVGKLGRVESALDPAPISMYENVIAYKPEYAVDEKGRRIRFQVDDQGNFVRSDEGDLIPDRKGRYFRNWRDEIQSPDDIWSEISATTNLPGVTGAPRLQPIETRLVMLQTGMRAPMGIKVSGPDLNSIEDFGQQLERILKTVPSISAGAVFADRVVGKPYMLIDIDREEIARHGLRIADVQRHLGIAVGGQTLGMTVEGRERYPIRVRYPRERRDSPTDLESMTVATPSGKRIPLSALAEIRYERGPQVIKSENTFLISYVLFDKAPGVAEVTAVQDAQKVIEQAIENGQLIVPAGVSFQFAGSYENQIRASKRLALVLPLSLLVIFLLLYFQFKSTIKSTIIFSGVAMAFSGGFIMLWLYGLPGFLDISIGAVQLQEVFQIRPFNLSVAVWVGFIALFGIATDDGVLMSTYLDQVFNEKSPANRDEVHRAVLEAAGKRIRPALMTTGTTLLALLPILTSTGRGSDIMVPMAIPSFGGMSVALITLFVVPVLYCANEERKLAKSVSGSSVISKNNPTDQ